MAGTLAHVLASRLDGVMLVIAREQVHRENARAVTQQLERVHANLLGVVFKKQK